MFDEGSIVLKRISLSKFGSNRKAAYKRRVLFDKLYLMAEFNPRNDGYGCLVTTISNLTHKIPILTHNEVRRGIDWLHENNFIHRERSSKYCNNGYLIKINHYEKLNKIKVLGNDDQLTSNCQPTDEQLTSITNEYIKQFTGNEKPTDDQLTNELKGNDDTYIQRKERKERKLKNSPKGEGDDTTLSPPKKRNRSDKPKIPPKTSAIYLAYKEAIAKRHKIELSPQGGADVRSVLSKLIDEWGEEKAIAIVNAYVDIDDKFINENLHHIKFLNSKINLVLKKAEKALIEAKEEIPTKWCPYREKMVPMTKILMMGEWQWI